MKNLSVIKTNDKGRLGTIVQEIETLETDAEKGQVAKAVREKISKKSYKKYKNKDYINALIRKAGLE